MREYTFEIWSQGKRLAAATDDDPIVAFQEALTAVESLEEYEIIEVTRKKVHSKDG